MKIRRVYMDHNATTPLHPRVKEAMRRAMEAFGNPSSLHGVGRRSRAMLEEARGKIAAFIGCGPEEIIFTGSGSEANNTVLFTLSCPSKHCGISPERGAHFITTRIEHPCVLEAANCLRERGVVVSYLDVDRDGKADTGRLKELLAQRPALVSVMAANNEIGTLQDIRAIARLSHEAGALFHTDAVQAVGKIPLDVKELDADFLTFSGHKIYGPKGVGVIYAKKGVPFCPFIRGGHQEQGRRAGTENTLGIIGMAAAIDARRSEMHEEWARLLKLKEILKKGIAEHIPDVRFNGHPRDSLAGTLNVSFPGAEGEAILLYLDLEGIAVSTGSACASGSLDPSHVLLAAGLSAEEAHGSIRFSLGRDNTQDDVYYVLEKLPKVIKRVRGMSTAYVPKGGLNAGR